MTMRVTSVVGEALHFGVRRMRTIMRTAWLPVVLLLVFEMATVFASLSVAAGRLITFRDISSFTGAQQVLARYAEAAWQNNEALMWTISGANILLSIILVASFMAPLVRYAGLGEKPAPGVVRLPFGPDQARFVLAGAVSFLILPFVVLAPITGVAYYAFQYAAEALSQTHASFPNPESLHTIELVPARETYASRNELWIYALGLPLGAIAPFALGLWALLTWHFRPRGGEGGLVRAAFLSLVGGAVVVGLVSFYYMQGAEAPEDYAAAIVVAVSAVMLGYFNLRALPYQAVAVCRRSMAPAGTLAVTRSGGLLRLFAAAALIGAILAAVLLVINGPLFAFVRTVANLLYQATASATKLTNSGVEPDWVRPFWIWTWNGFKIVANIFIAFFCYGVWAGLLGRLYKESERARAPA